MIHTKFMLCCLLSVLLLSCSEDDDIVRHSEKNAIFVYMAADNDLDYFGTALKKCVSPFFIFGIMWYYTSRCQQLIAKPLSRKHVSL